MSPRLLIPIVLLALMPGAAAGSRHDVAHLTIHQRIVIRIRHLAHGSTRGRIDLPGAGETVWSEHKGPACISMAALYGAVITAPDSVDLMVDGGRRLRARLDDACTSLDFYSGFYLKPTADGLMCAGRDAIRSRSGGSCPIAGLRRLTPKH